MYSPMTGEDKIAMALDIFRRFETCPGEGLPSNVLMVHVIRAGKKERDLRAGLELGTRRRWFEVRSDGFVTLTNLGFDQI